LVSGLDRANTVPVSAHSTMTMPIRSPLAVAISLARRLSFSSLQDDAREPFIFFT